MRMVFASTFRVRKCSTIAFTSVAFCDIEHSQGKYKQVTHLIYESCKTTCELLFWFRKFTKRSVEYHKIAARHSVEAYTPAKSDSLRNFHKPPPEKMQCLGIAIVELDQQNP